MRDYSKLLAATLLTLSCALVGAAPGQAATSPAHTARHNLHPLHSRGAGLTRCRPIHVLAGGCGAGNGGTRIKALKDTVRRMKPRHERVAKPHAPKLRTPAARRPDAAESAAASIAAVLAVPCQNTELTPDATNLPVARAATLCLINRIRAEHDERPLKANAQLEEAAAGHVQELIADDYFAHISPSGETPVDRVQGTGYIPGPSVGYVIGENLAWGTYILATPQAIVSAWVASPEHLANILESQYLETGIGITPAVPQSLGEGNPGATYAQEFGVIVR